MIIEKDISQLAVGSYVVEIVKQSGNFILKQPGWVRDFHAIENLIHQGVQRVSIDTSKQLPNESELKSHQENKIPASSKVKKVVKAANKGDNNFHKEEMAERFFQAKALFSEAKAVQAKLLDDIEQGRAIDARTVVDLTNQSIDAIFENPDALACVINIRSKDEYLLEHSISVSILMAIFGKYLNLDRGIISDLTVGAFLHDVGKIKVPSKILNKPAKLTAEEFEVIKSHVVHSAHIVNNTEGISELSRKVVAEHHEKLDGRGYPLGKSAEELGRYSRMITICDIFDALAADRVYKKGIPQIKAFAILRELASNGELDPELVDHFIHCLGVYPVGSLVRLSSEKLAMVERVNQNKPLRPVVRAFFSLRQNVFIEAKDIDLSKDESQQIEQGVRADDFDLDMNKIAEFLMIQG